MSKFSATEKVFHAQALLEEFGKWIKNGTSAKLAERNEFYQAIYQQVYQVHSSSGITILSASPLSITLRREKGYGIHSPFSMCHCHHSIMHHMM